MLNNEANNLYTHQMMCTYDVRGANYNIVGV